ncbi:Ca-activated chloride channel family protein [Allocatelliglobosispora scoriae]|uniref:Ca-activated chloride channel family protein n=1 Tax=Allocatelliglobosispora scoriae TaxID=643052 RepID=A0A841BRW6_9ACTN|nr:VWA domain-containing protein [Allocatelliglobosispora scoriae]MBB5870136.1 Ca-activated chloride channel family protein [Allocatelliglobosispora scoriae]
MSLTWPLALIALLAVPALLALWWWMSRRRRRVAIRVSSIALIRAALPGRSLWRRRIPVALFVLGLLLVAFSITRPQASIRVPSNSTSVLLAFDVSSSMCSTDVDPNRLTVARAAAREFVEAQEEGTRIGLVTFSGIAGLMVAPTTDKKALLAAIDTLRTSRGTAIGQGILTSIDAIAESNTNVAPTGVVLDAPEGGPPGAIVGYEADTIVVLTDGANTQGVDPIIAAEQAGARRVRIYTIGFGTTTPAPMACSPDQISGGGNGFRGDPGRFGGGGNARNLEIDEPTLQEVAKLTGGEYYRAEDAEQLVDVLTDLPSNIVTQEQEVELTVWFVLGAALLVLLAIVLSLRWNRPTAYRVPRPS